MKILPYSVFIQGSKTKKSKDIQEKKVTPVNKSLLSFGDEEEEEEE